LALSSSEELELLLEWLVLRRSLESASLDLRLLSRSAQSRELPRDGFVVGNVGVAPLRLSSSERSDLEPDSLALRLLSLSSLSNELSRDGFVVGNAGVASLLLSTTSPSGSNIWPAKFNLTLFDVVFSFISFPQTNLSEEFF
jgi:hypothetical protein